MTVLERIKILADKRGKTLRQVTDDLNFSENYLYSLKNKTPNGQTLEKLADYFHVTVDFLLGRENKADYKFDSVPFSVDTIKHSDGQFEIKTKHLESVDQDLLRDIDFAKSKVLNSFNGDSENNSKSKQYTAFRIEQFFIDELIAHGVEVIKLKEEPESKPIDLKKSLVRKIQLLGMILVLTGMSGFLLMENLLATMLKNVICNLC